MTGAELTAGGAMTLDRGSAGDTGAGMAARRRSWRVAAGEAHPLRTRRQTALACAPCGQQPLDGEGQRARQHEYGDVDPEDGERTQRFGHLTDAGRDAEIRRGGIVVIEMATPTVELARVSSESIPATPAAKATRTVDALTVVRPESADSPIAKCAGSRAMRSPTPVSTPPSGTPRPSRRPPSREPGRPVGNCGPPNPRTQR